MSSSRKRLKLEAAEPELAAFEKLNLVLGRHYFDVQQRLSLDLPLPFCVRNVSVCATTHVRKSGIRTRIVGSMCEENTREQIREQRPDQFVYFLFHALRRQEFIGSNLFVAGLELILTIDEPPPELQADYAASEVLLGTYEALEKCLDRFPPCRWDLRPAYHDIIFGHFDAPCFSKCDPKEGLLKNTLYLLEHLIENDDQPNRAIERTTRARKPNADSNSSSWRIGGHRQSYDFEQLPREERFKRLFMVLELLVKLLEMDLAMWILRNPSKTQQNLCNRSHCPLIAQLVWRDCAPGVVNLFIRKLFEAFVNINALEYPEQDITVISRLLNLITVAVNLSEFQDNDGMIEYPCLKENSIYFAKQLWTTMEKSAYFGMRLCLASIRHVRTPYLIHFLVNQLIRKLNPHLHPPNIRGFFQQLLNRQWVAYGSDMGSVATSPSTTLAYPVLNRNQKRAISSDITCEQYVDLVFRGFQAYCDMYAIAAYFREFASKQESEDVDMESDDQSAPLGSKEGLTREALESIPRDIRIVSQPVPDDRMVFRGINVTTETVLEYRENLKYLLLIEQQLKKLETVEERQLFHKSISFLSSIDPLLVI
ncbi:hypothetical protein AND_002631 [Anopheles darlingi]|uniref:Uncharacterized protein n=1 Tax=Anopheles darlingi TaxID=43151 RepID=W5JQL9_ANODA|nr:hypothetical protein AND_002631 [Anopheles darlingi]